MGRGAMWKEVWERSKAAQSANILWWNVAKVKVGNIIREDDNGANTMSN